MVTMSTLEKITHVSKLSDCIPISESSAARDNKLDISGEDGDSEVNKFLSRLASQSHKMRSDGYMDSTSCKMDRQLVGVIGAQNESSLFSSSLSDLFSHKMELSSNNFPYHQFSAISSQRSEADAFKSQDEAVQKISNLLPDEEELFTGMVDEMGCMSHAHASDDLEDFDLFTCSGGIELESDDPSQAAPRNIYPRDLNQNQNSVPTSRYPSSVVVNGASPPENSLIFNGFQSPVRLSSIGREFGVDEARRSFPKVQHESQGIPIFEPHSLQTRLPNVGNLIPHNSLDGVRGIVSEIRPTVPEKFNFELPHMRLNGHAMEIGDGAFTYSPNGTNVHQSVTSKSSSYQHQHLRSLLMRNSVSFLNNNHAPNIIPGAPHLMMNTASPVHQLHVGSAPVVKASIWDRQQLYSGGFRESSGYQIGGIRGAGIPRDISSHGSYPHINGACAEVAKNSPQQMNHLFHERNLMNGSYGSPSERARSRRSETQLSHADRKHYELDIDRILRGEDNRTTLMIKNIPNKYTSKMLLATIDEQHRGKYDFVYLPIDFKNKCNMGYAFINMVDPCQIVAFHQTFDGRKWEKFNSEKVATLAYARIQGKAALIAHFQNSSLMNEDKRCRPILFHTHGPNAGDQEPFPVATNFRPKSGRLQASSGEDLD